MAKLKKRDDRRYQKSVIVGKKPNGKYIKKSVYGKTQKELEANISRPYKRDQQRCDGVAKRYYFYPVSKNMDGTISSDGVREMEISGATGN